MQPQVITVHDIYKAIDDVGVMPYANKIIQEMGGEYWFIDAELRQTGPDDDPKPEWKLNRIDPVPLKLAHFIIETLRLKAQFSRLGVGNIDEPVKQSVYLLPGAKIFGHEITEATEIPAEMRPIVVEEL